MGPSVQTRSYFPDRIGTTHPRHAPTAQPILFSKDNQTGTVGASPVVRHPAQRATAWSIGSGPQEKIAV